MSSQLPGVAMGTAMRDAGGQTAVGGRTLGFDTHSLIADPKFVDPSKDDYSLKRASPALALGFEPIDLAGIGLHRSTGD